MDLPRWTLVAFVAALTLALMLRGRARLPRPVAIYLPYLWTFFVVFLVAELGSFRVAVWGLALLSFLALREYFTLVDLRIQDRWALWAAYLSIPFMYWWVATDWYGMFIISIPVYGFLVVPFAVTLGGREAEGSVLSIGAIDLGLFLLVYCVGHVAYLTFHSTWMAVFLVLSVAACDLAAVVFKSRDRPLGVSVAWQVLAPLPVTLALGLAFMPWTGIPRVHTVALALMIPALVAIGCHTMDHLERDLGIDRDRLAPGRGEVLNSLKSYLYTAPVGLHYLRYVLDAF